MSRLAKQWSVGSIGLAGSIDKYISCLWAPIELDGSIDERVFR